MTNIINGVVVTVIFVGCYFISYCAFSNCFYDDIEFGYGKARIRNRRKKTKSFIKRFLFLDVKGEVIKWHYVLFWINIISYTPMLISINLFVLTQAEKYKTVFFVCGALFLLSLIPVAFARWDLYKGNMIRNRKKYRKKHK